MASGWYHKAFDRIKQRSLFVKVAPMPSGLSERRGVLHLLKQHGQIEVFKRLSVSSHDAAPTTSPHHPQTHARDPEPAPWLTRHAS